MTGDPLSLAHRDILAPLLAARWDNADPPEATLADPWFANLFLFRAAHDWRWLRGEWPCIAGHAYDGTRFLLPLFDLTSAPVDALRALLTGGEVFGPLSGSQVSRLKPAEWCFSHAREDADYVYSAEQFRQYRGRLLQKKRNLVKQLLAQYDVEVVPYSTTLFSEGEQILETWLENRGKQPGETDDGPCRDALALADQLALEGTIYRIGGQAAGFVLAETIRPGLMVMRFAKALDAYKGLYQHMFQQFCQARPALQWLNFEQDLGIATFRQTKLSYQPVALLNKVRATTR
jgi:uncharacterized protein